MKPKLNLVDIAGLDTLSIWPLAPGWWILIATFFILMGSMLFFYVKKKSLMNTPRYRILQELNALEKNLPSKTAKEASIEVSALIRRLALQLYSRSDCASLQGLEWIQWLNQKDAKKFDWSGISNVLLELPFQENRNAVDLSQVQAAIRAAKGWVQ
jgi:hypothetical protein